MAAGEVWLVMRWWRETDEQTGMIRGRYNEIERLDGTKPAEWVMNWLERWYAKLYQPHWDEATSKPEETARMSEGVIKVGHNPEASARLIAADWPVGKMPPGPGA